MNYPFTRDFLLKPSGLTDADLDEMLRDCADDICKLMNFAYAEGVKAGKKAVGA